MRHRENVQHLDDSTIQAMLDRELSDAENEAAATHAEECAACAARIAEERFIMSEADRLITELDAPRPAAPQEVAPPPGFASGEGALGEGAPLEPMKRGAPVVLMPGAADPRWQRRPRPGRYAAWAAMVAVAAGAGYFAYEARSGNPAASDIASDVPASVAPVAAPEGEMALVDSPAVGGSAAGRLGGSAAGDTAVPSEVETAEPPPPDRPTAAELAAADRQAEREADERDAELEAARERSRLAAAAATRQRARMAAASQPVSERSRAEEVVRTVEPPVATPQAAQRPPLEQQAQIAFRLGLDEAQRMLGGIPVHAIEGLQPELVGAVQGHLVPGADPTAYVVRVVYLDDDGRMILLDQQRLSAAARASGAGRDTTPPFWVKGDVRLRLTGQVPSESIADLAARVR